MIYTSGMFVPIIAAFYLKNSKQISKQIFYIALLGTVLLLIMEFKILRINVLSIIPSIFISSGMLIIILLKNRKLNLKVDNT